jgi:hypothetical protein
MSKPSPIDSYLSEVRLRLPSNSPSYRRTIKQVSEELAQGTRQHLWASLSHGDDVSFEEAERRAIDDLGPPRVTARSPSRLRNLLSGMASAAMPASTSVALVAIVLAASAITLINIGRRNPAPTDGNIADRAVAAAHILPLVDAVEIERGAGAYEIEFLRQNGEVEVHLDRDFNVAPTDGDAPPTGSEVAQAQRAARTLAGYEHLHKVERGERNEEAYEVEFETPETEFEVWLDDDFNVVVVTTD